MAPERLEFSNVLILFVNGRKCLAGNIMTASLISDLNPLLLARRAVLHVADSDGNIREVVMDSKFFTGYRQTCLNSTDTVLSVTVPFTKPNEYFFGYKQANRKEDDIAIVNAGMRVDLGDSDTHVQDISLAFGGMSVTTVLATRTMAALIGRTWDDDLLKAACSRDLLPADLPLAPGSPGGMVAYRRALTLSFFYRFYCAVSQRVEQISQLANPNAVSDIPYVLSSGSQYYRLFEDSKGSQNPDVRPVIHRSAFQQTTGEATCVDNIPATDGELHPGFVLSPKAHAKILHLDASKAIATPGVVDFITCQDVPGSNIWEGEHESVFASIEVSERCLLTLANVYKVLHVHISSLLCRTNIPSCTAFRGFGSPQAVATIESILEYVVVTLDMPVDKFRTLNFYKQGDTTAYGQVIQQSNLLQCWEACQRLSVYAARLHAVEHFNKFSRWKKRGISIVPLTYGIGFPLKLLNQGSAVVNVYRDGSVLLLLGGVEMGQGLHTKMIQVASQVLDVPSSFIHVPDTSTNSTPNSSPTAGSMTSDLVGMAVLQACEELKKRIHPFQSKDTKKD